MRFLMNLDLIMYLTVPIITLRCCTGLTRLKTTSVVRAKKNLQYRGIKWKRRLPKNVLSDVIIELMGFYPKQYCLELLRLVRYWNEEKKREFVFLTNAMYVSSIQVAEFYKNRWQIELSNGLSSTLKSRSFWVLL